MEDKTNNSAVPETEKSRSGCLRVLKFVTIFFVVITLLVLVWVKYNIYASKFTPVQLNTKEQKILDSKLALLEESAQKEHVIVREKKYDKEARLKPEPYTEKGAKREISLSERELNALIADRPDVAQKVAIDLSDNLVSIKLVVPIDEDILFFGGKTLRFNMGVILSYENDHPVVALKGISLGGIPLPNAWLGYMKNKNLVEEFGSEGGFWQLFAEGVKDIKVQDGHIRIRLNE